MSPAQRRENIETRTETKAPKAFEARRGWKGAGLLNLPVNQRENPKHSGDCYKEILVPQK